MKTLMSLRRKKYRITTEVKRFFRKKYIVFEYQQATLRELLDMIHYMETGDADGFLFEFFRKRGAVGEKEFKKMSNILRKDLLQKIMDTYGYKFFSSEDKKKGKSKSPIYSAIIFLLQKTNETMESLLDMTWEKVEFLYDGVGWNANAETKDGQRKNRSKMAMEEFRNEISDEEALKLAKTVIPKDELKK